ncbi:MAG: DbpA RNA binding domain-containing protein [Methylococcales bacterium]|nr:DbpA RNA binding domain-containing protein [Methylococcales bacterium]
MKRQLTQEGILKNILKELLGHNDMALHQDLVSRLAEELDVSVLECAAALSLFKHPNLFNKKEYAEAVYRDDSQKQYLIGRSVRYRVDLGAKQQMDEDELKDLLVEIAGVDRRSITRVEIKNTFTLVDLPEGMTADIFQLLSEAEIRNNCLNLRRIKFQRRFQRREIDRSQGNKSAEI